MKKSTHKAIKQVCLQDRLENARLWYHTDSRAVEEKIYRVHNKTLREYFQNKEGYAYFVTEAEKIGICMRPEMTYGEMAANIYRYANRHSRDYRIKKLAVLFLNPVNDFAGQINWVPEKGKENTPDEGENKRCKKRMILNTFLKKNHMRDFFIRTDEYALVLEQMFPNTKFKDTYDKEIDMDSLFEYKAPPLMEIIYMITNDTDVLERKWDLLLRYIFEPACRIETYKEKKHEKFISDN